MSDRFKRITVQHDEHTTLVGRVNRLPSRSLEYDSFNVVVAIAGAEYTITSALTDEQRSHFLQAFELELEQKHLDALNDTADAIINDWDEVGA